MSTIYIQEPPTSGKVLLETSVGDIDIELWSKETPKACRNFVQLCLEGFYNGTIFHRAVKGFIVQGGDPTGTGTGGESIYEHPFKNELHSRLRFNRRGLVALANSGQEDNGSQFFFTMAPTPELQNKHTIFGKVAGDTVYNMLKLEDGLVDKDDRPLYPHKIVKASVLSNPFEDIVPRTSPKAQSAKLEKAKKDKKSGVKNFKLLSFGEEAEEDEEETLEAIKKFSGKSKSTHDLLNDPKLSSQPAIETRRKKGKKVQKSSDEELSGDEQINEDSSDSDTEDERRRVETIKGKLKKREEVKPESKDDSVAGYELGQDKREEQLKRAEEIRKEIRSLKRDMVESKKRKLEEDTKENEDDKSKEESNSTLVDYWKEQEKYKNIKQQQLKGDARQSHTLELLSKFQKKLEAANEVIEENEDNVDEKIVDDEDGDNWLTHTLKFESGDLVLAKDANTKGDDWFEIYDPRNPINKRRREQKNSSRR